MKANETQVGGAHYKTDGIPQHWDIAVMHQFDYFQGQITKYLMRWKSKYPTPEKKLEDLRKARHFLDKYIEEYEKFLPKPSAEVMASKAELEAAILLSAYETANPRFVSDQHYLAEGGWGDGRNLYTCQLCREKVVADGLEAAHRAHDHVCGVPPPPHPATTPLGRL